MTISLSAPRATELKPRIVVFGIGGAGGNAVNNMIDAGLEGGLETELLQLVERLDGHLIARR